MVAMQAHSYLWVSAWRMLCCMSGAHMRALCHATVKTWVTKENSVSLLLAFRETAQDIGVNICLYGGMKHIESSALGLKDCWEVLYYQDIITACSGWTAFKRISGFLTEVKETYGITKCCTVILTSPCHEYNIVLILVSAFVPFKQSKNADWA